MLYYLGKIGDQFKKEECREYKTKDGALKATTKDESLCVWDEDGNLITIDLKKGKKPSEPEEQEEVKEPSEPGQQEKQKEKVIIPQERMKATVICGGTLNIRRTPEWGNDNICGRATKGQSYYVKEIHMVDGKQMVRTIGDLYLSGESQFVKIEKA